VLHILTHGPAPYAKRDLLDHFRQNSFFIGGNVRAGRTLYDLLNKYFRPGDIFTHMYGGRRGEQDPDTKGPSQAVIDGRRDPCLDSFRVDRFR